MSSRKRTKQSLDRWTHSLKKQKTNRKYQDNDRWSLPLYGHFLYQSSCSCRQRQVRWAPLIGPSAVRRSTTTLVQVFCRKEGIGLERIHTMQQVSRTSPPHRDATDLRTGRSGQWKLNYLCAFISKRNSSHFAENTENSTNLTTTRHSKGCGFSSFHNPYTTKLNFLQFENLLKLTLEWVNCRKGRALTS